ncbi:hypothetical protein V6N12_045973 [Hibiscus sabdariffa]|uniref:Uncharacterized protein n=1 Tax=Hibiscus sabdariffa TaxID=183260 RepID=A0ABR2G4B8_9ROSI
MRRARNNLLGRIMNYGRIKGPWCDKRWCYRNMFDEFKQLQLLVFGCVSRTSVLDSCNGLICLILFHYEVLNFVLWNLSIQKYISLPQPSISEDVELKFGFGLIQEQMISRKNEEVLLDVDRGKMASLGLNCLKMKPHVVEGVEVATLITLEGTYIESLVLLYVHSGSLVRTGKYIHMLFH